MMKKLFFVLSFLIYTLAGQLAFAQCEGCPVKVEKTTTVEGYVLDEKGEKVSAMKVYAFPTDRPINGRLTAVYTDKDGKFKFDFLAAGKYKFHAVDKSRGYPDTIFALYSDNRNSTPEVEIVPEQKIENVAIVLGKPLEVMEFELLDELTNLPVSNAVITIYKADDPSVWMSTGQHADSPDGVFSLLVPTEFAIKIDADGYQKWSYSRESGVSNKTVLKDQTESFQSRSKSSNRVKVFLQK